MRKNLLSTTLLAGLLISSTQSYCIQNFNNAEKAKFKTMLQEFAKISFKMNNVSDFRGLQLVLKTKLRQALKSGNANLKDLMNKAIICNDIQAVKILIKKGIGVNQALSANGQTAIMTLIVAQEMFKFDATELVKFLITHGANPTIESVEKVNAIHLATLLDNHVMLRIFRKYGY